MTLSQHLAGVDPACWLRAVESLAPQIHVIDRTAARIWMAAAVWPGAPALAGRVDAAHTLLYGHRFWPQIKRTILKTASEASWPDLPALVTKVADATCRTTAVDREQLLGISAAALWVLRQTGLEAFAASAGAVQLPHRAHVRSIRQVLRRRRLQAHPGIWRAVFGGSRVRVVWDESRRGARYAAAKGDVLSADAPAESGIGGCQGDCRCAVGLLVGADHVSAFDPVGEGRALAALGVPQTYDDAGRPLIRLACVARLTGDVTFAKI